jgi:hypothetical protein
MLGFELKPTEVFRDRSSRRCHYKNSRKLSCQNGQLTFENPAHRGLNRYKQPKTVH